MKTRTLLYSASVFALAIVALQAADKIDTKNLVTGKAAFADAKDLKPGTYHKITAADLPKPFETPSGRGFGPVAARGDLMPKLPGHRAGFGHTAGGEGSGSIRNLVRLGWLEPRNAGPRGGVRYFTTPAGKAQLESIQSTQE